MKMRRRTQKEKELTSSTFRSENHLKQETGESRQCESANKHRRSGDTSEQQQKLAGI